LAWLLKRFLYHPVLDAIDAREARIAEKLADAAACKAEAEKDRDSFQQKNDDFDRQRASLLETATQEAKDQRKRLLDDARMTADELTAKQQDALRRDARHFSETLRHRTQEEVFAIARRTLADLADADLQAQMIALFLRKLRPLEGQTKAELAEAVARATEPAIVRAAFDLSEDQRVAIQAAIDETFGGKLHLRFETAPDIVSGIELTINGRKLGWSIAEYLTSLEKSVAALLQPEPSPESETARP
jgi:F-type H+-transporting ATPase subunit b